MIKINSHDGPARLGKIEDQTTPILYDYKEVKKIENIATPYKIQKEIAEEYVEQTIDLAKKETNKDKIGVIQGAQYTDLRVNCAQKLEKEGYTTLMFANTDELQRNPQDLLEIIIETRENIKPTTSLYFPFATTQIIPILTYLGIDIFDNSRAIYEAKNNHLMTNNNIYTEEYNITENILEENMKQLEFTIKEVRENMKNKTLRNLTEQRATTNPELMTLHRLMDKNYQKYLLKYTQLY
ncbi:archaeosine tRNA-ribosyltransferase [Methanosphaera sp. ISO3-F5]|uniref:archaeosine tRNA-ribosyltransferase n=1 Tax=Methanosphaera sp. ISO3-F5 TaxID=1452353 RepID=UPI002B25BF18|nr:archaeosine tRNA-ribosyltransferase [Methanosphaera sp. ISO3-F5]WQH64701.1 archaeosine tRNA-ribosyltransferase [Methanosphaera sp. ISO3-F5]